MERSTLVDVQPVLRHFGGTKRLAIETYAQFVEAALAERSRDEYYRAAEGRVLGSGEFVEKIRHRVGEHPGSPRMTERTSINELLSAAARTSGLRIEELCGKSKNRRTVAAKEAVIVVGRERGISNRELAEALGIGASAVTKRIDAVRSKQGKHLEADKLRKALRKRK